MPRSPSTCINILWTCSWINIFSQTSTSKFSHLSFFNITFVKKKKTMIETDQLKSYTLPKSFCYVV